MLVLAGGNGSGKSTFYRTRLQAKNIKFINADQIGRKKFTKNKKTDAKRATMYAQKQVLKLLKNGESFCYETVFSHPSKIEILEEAKKHGYRVELAYFHLDLPKLNIARVMMRVKEGGHDVPRAKIQSRIPKTMKNIKKAIALTDKTYIFDNSWTEEPFRKIATVENGTLTEHVDTLPNWAKNLLKSYQSKRLNR